MYEYDLIVVGAGPYGRSIAAHATAAGLNLRLLGRRTQRAALPVDERTVDERTVTAVRPYGRDGFEVVTEDGESMRTRTVALALGAALFTEQPTFAEHPTPAGEFLVVRPAATGSTPPTRPCSAASPPSYASC